MKFTILHGPNLNKLGSRDLAQYGTITQSGLLSLLGKEFPDDDFELIQSNHEGVLIDAVQQGDFDGLLANFGGYSHSSVAIRDALSECIAPKVEVHLSHLAKREEFRQVNITAAACDGYLSGFREHGYVAGILLLKRLILERQNQ